MVDWKSPFEITKEYLVFDGFMHVLTGVYVWECIISLDFDFQFITRQRPFQWPMILYFFNKYFRLLSIIGLIFGVNWTIPSAVDCQFVYTFTLFFASAATGFSCMILSLRTMAVWGMRWRIVAPLIVINLGHWGFLMTGPSLTPTWVMGQDCTTANKNKPLLAVTWVYTMTLDFIVMALMAAKLFKIISRSRLADLVFRDGLIYFIIAFLTNLVATTLMLLNLNPVMFEIATFPAATIQSIVACRVVRRLVNFSSSGVETFSAIGPLVFLSNPNMSLKISQLDTEEPEAISVNNGTAKSHRCHPESLATPYQSGATPAIP